MVVIILQEIFFNCRSTDFRRVFTRIGKFLNLIQILYNYKKTKCQKIVYKRKVLPFFLLLKNNRKKTMILSPENGGF